MNKIFKNKGLTLVEVIVGVSLFLIIALSVYNAFTTLFQVVSMTRVKIAAVSLANEQFEIAKNLAYSDLGVENGSPSGLLLHEQNLVRDGYTFYVLTTVRDIDDPFDGTAGGSPNDTSPADSKLVEIEVDCESCKSFTPIVLTSRVAPAGLESESDNGSLFIHVIDAAGNPVEDARIDVAYPAQYIDIENESSNVNGDLQLVNVPPGANAYQISVSKDGYTSEQTYDPANPAMPNPVLPHATVVAQQVTQITFVIDHVSSIRFESKNSSCTSIGGFDFGLVGEKILALPDLRRSSSTEVTNGSGILELEDMPWDTFNIIPQDSTYELAGTNPVNPFDLLPGVTQSVDLILKTKNPKSLLVAVLDSNTVLPISDATVTVTNNGNTEDLQTGQGYQTQTDWSGDAGQENFEDPTKYFYNDGDIETDDPVGVLKLDSVFGEYVLDGFLESSTFDVGTTSNFVSLLWEPVAQDPDTGENSLQFQVATATTSSSTWEFVGPDGTDASYFDSTAIDFDDVHDGDRYLRYKAFLSTASTTLTPLVSDVSFTFNSGCVPPGQAFFTGLSSGTTDLTVEKDGYETFTIEIPITEDWTQYTVILQPEV
jgi:type II secretory pathway pseudopilin PulG